MNQLHIINDTFAYNQPKDDHITAHSPVIVVVVGESEVAAVRLVHQLPQMRVRRRLKTDRVDERGSLSTVTTKVTLRFLTDMMMCYAVMRFP